MTEIIPYLSEKSKQYQRELAQAKKSVEVSNNWYSFRFGTGQYQVVSNQTINGLWGIAYWDEDLKQTWYFSATTDPTKEREEVSKLLAIYGIAKLADGQNDRPKINANNNADFSEAYANWIIERFIEFQWEIYVNGNKRQITWDFLKPTTADITNYQNGDFKALKASNDPEKLKADLATAKTAQATAETNLKTKTDELKTATDAKAQAEKDKETTKAEAAKNLKDLQDAQTAIKQKDTDIATRDQTIKDKEGELTKAKEQITTLTTEKATLDTTFSQLDIDNADLQRKLGVKDKVIVSLNSSISTLKKKVAELETKKELIAQVEVSKS